MFKAYADLCEISIDQADSIVRPDDEPAAKPVAEKPA
jgi:hypothetical protein